ncbi:MAG TPA: DNA adenine methylase [Candidatus Binataceae bacterium]|nr:DNA adenine methylase [Candidatus Binataceae bacterium]
MAVESAAARQNQAALGTKVSEPAPFLKWAGGKTQLLPYLTSMLPKRFENYAEPFVGSAALFFWLKRNRDSFQARLFDRNDELVNCYVTVRDQIERLIPLLEELRDRHGKRFYYKVRSQRPQSLSELERAARLIYLNKTCFNGLYRINSQGQFNVPIGSYKRPRIFDDGALRAASRALIGVTIMQADFAAIEHHCRAGDLVYFDPPYYPVSKTANFTAYALGSDGRPVFGLEEHRRLAATFRNLDRKNCYTMLSNSDSEAVRELYRGWRIRVAPARRAINSDGSARGAVNEIIVTNY